jgi:PAS domain S-box-containing protein
LFFPAVDKVDEAPASAALQDFLDHALVAMHWLGPDGTILWANRAELALLGYAPEEYLGRPAEDFHANPESGRLLADHLASGEGVRDCEAALRHRDGSLRHVLISAHPFHDPGDGRLLHSRCFLQDITGRKRAEQELQKRNQLLAVILENTPVMASRIDTRGVLTESFGAGLRSMGLADGQVVGLNALECWPECRAYLERALAGEPVHWVFEAGAGGDTRYFEVWYVPDSVRKGEIIGFGVDITDLKRAEEELGRSEALNRRIIESSRDCIQILDGEGRLLSTSRVGQQLLEAHDPDALAGISWIDLWRGADRARAGRVVEEALRSGAGKFQGVCPTLTGRDKWWDVLVTPILDPEGEPRLLLAVSRDITEQKAVEEALRRSEEQLRQSQKMDAIGRLAGGVAHDFNNLLTAITGYSDILLRAMPADNPLRGNVEEIRKAGDRAASLTRQLLTFSRKRVAAPRVFDLRQAVTDMRRMLERLIGEDIQLSMSAEEDLSPGCADPGQVEQVILNLVVNARDAMPRGGKLTVEAVNARLGDALPGAYFPAVPGEYIRLTVRDTGVGMDREVRSHLFEPFFTTKPPGHGTGLGLSTVYGIVQQAEGNLTVRSEPGKGTEISVYIPAGRASEASPDQEARPAAEAKTKRAAETILLVEDEDVVRKLLAQVLSAQGYAVMEAGSGPAALEAVARHRGPIDLLLTDVVMSGMSGRELSERLIALRPCLRVLYMSGYTEDAVLRHGVFRNRMAFLGKPFSPLALVRRIKEMLEAPPPGPSEEKARQVSVPSDAGDSSLAP